jgi:cytochrome P450
MGPLVFLHRDASFKRAVKVMNDYTGPIIDKALQKKASSRGSEEIDASGGRLVFLDELVKDTSDKKRIRDLLVNGLVGGRDTTMGLLSHVFFFLSRNQSVLQKLRDEIARLNGVPPTYEQFKDLKYLRWVVDESKYLPLTRNLNTNGLPALRLMPPVPLWDREAKRDVVLPKGGGRDGTSPLFVPKGQSIFYNFWGLCHCEEEWGPEVEKFMPERWDGIKYSWHFTPFGGGGRICPGRKFSRFSGFSADHLKEQLALNQASYIIVRMLQTFSGLESRDDSPWVADYGITLAPHHGCKVSLTR